VHERNRAGRHFAYPDHRQIAVLQRPASGRVSRGLDPELKQRLRELFLTLQQDREARPLLSRLQIDRFVEGDDAMYDSVRQMRRELKTQH